MSRVRATVRLQLHRGFGFDAAAATVDYYAALGISHFYVSPIFAAREGSTHGYDVVDPARINPELGGEQGLLRLVAALRAAGMGLVIDIVPNHMGVASKANRYWQHVLEHGRHSPYAHWFDIDWQSPLPHLHGKLLLPVLGEPYEAVLASGQLALGFDAADGRFFVSCYDSRLPLAPASYAGVLVGQPALAGTAETFTAPQTGAAIEAAHARLAALAATGPGQRALEEIVRQHHPTHGGADALHRLLAQQHYRLSWWRNAAEEINWRRFFEVSDLAGVRVEQDDVFDATHALVFALYARGLIDGVRVDHVDGLADPGAYCRKLRRRLSGLQAQRPSLPDEVPAWIVVEKILSPGEGLPASWHTDGSTGYDFMDQAGAVLHDGEGEQALRVLWAELSGDTRGFDDHVQAARQQLLAENFGGELDALARTLYSQAVSLPPAGRDIALSAIRRVLTALLAGFRRYRCYSADAAQGAADRQVLAEAVARARRQLRPPDHGLLAGLALWLGAEPSPDGAVPEPLLRARTRFEQLTPPLAAKAMEDTVFYRYAPLLSRNEVGSCPEEVAPGLDVFHALNRQRAEHLPRSLLATATHDHKRGEDMRARLAVLSEMPDAWGQRLRRWHAAHQGLRTQLPAPGGGTVEAPSAADEIMLYQTLAGAWPPALAADDAQGIAAFAERVAAWQEKALREAKQHSSWMLPQADYEAACRAFLTGLLRDPPGRSFVAELAAFVEAITPAATANSLTQTLLRLTSPGIPDLYQGCEGADFSLVDPDNRRAVDMAARRDSLHHPWPAGGEAGPQTLSGKQALIRLALQLRRQHPDLFCGGDYLPLEVLGPLQRHVIAFARQSGAVLSITVALRHPAQWLAAAAPGWQGTQLVLAADFPQRWQDILSGTEQPAAGGKLALADVFTSATVALLIPVQAPP